MWAPQTVEFVDAFPLTEFGKVDKKALRERHAART
jgi:non-ribosomal peptide synthetase component E (peptide arylation enzyme)